jgi:hypothetical protein
MNCGTCSISLVRIGLVLLAASLFSCGKFVDIEPSGPALTGQQVFANDSTAEAAMSGLYQGLLSPPLNLTNGGATLYAALTADELYPANPNAEYESFAKNDIKPTSSVALTRLWTAPYRNIYHATAILEGLSQSGSLSPGVKQRLRGEALVVRSLNYFYLAGFFGDVPLVLTTDQSANTILPRTPKIDVYRQLANDLAEAKTLLTETYFSTGRARPNKWAAAALLSRVYLYQQDWMRAEAEAGEVINNSLYSLVRPADVFLSGSREAIWQVSPVSALQNIAEGSTFIPASATARPPLAATGFLLNAFEPGDQRKQQWLRRNVVAGQEYYYPYKYKMRSNPSPFVESYMVLRLAEQYLIRAEARARLAKLMEARQDLDVLRQRAGLPPVSANTQDEVLRGVEQERRVELFAEWGHRWLDLARTGRADAVLGPIKAPGWQPHDILYPLPAEDIERNRFLVQNPGY